jgi:RimK family alpha-L-glutamate ligase
VKGYVVTIEGTGLDDAEAAAEPWPDHAGRLVCRLASTPQQEPVSRLRADQVAESLHSGSLRRSRARRAARLRRVWIVGSGENETNQDVVARWRAAGLAARMIAPDRAPARVAEGDVAIGRIDVRRSVDGIEPGLLALLELSRLGARVVNMPAAILAGHDKLRTARALVAAGLPHPRTAHLQPGGPVPLSPPLVVKPRFGSWGTDVFRCLTQEEVARTVKLLSGRPWFRRQGAVVQELVPSAGHDLRVLVAGGRVVGADRRVAPAGEWRTNVSLGATELPARPSPAAAALAVAAVDALGGDLFGVDLIPGPGGYLVLEVNAAIEFDDLYSLHRRDVYVDTAAALDLLAPAVRVRPAAARSS